MDDQRTDRESGKRTVERILLWLMPLLFAARAIVNHRIETARGLIVCGSVLGVMLLFVAWIEVSWRRKT